MGKRFGLGLVVAWLACLAWPGCKGDYTSIIVPNEDGGRFPSEGGGPPVDAGDTCPTTTPIDLVTLPAWKRPTAPQPGKCQADDLTAMRDYLAENPKATNEEFENFVKNRDTVCHDCVFGDANGATWPPAPVLDGKVVTFDVGACYALVSGKEACGKATQNAWDCEFQACADCTAQSELDGCRVRSRATVCKATFDTSRADCAEIPAGTDSLCGTPFDSIRVQCITNTVDAGKL